MKMIFPVDALVGLAGVLPPLWILVIRQSRIAARVDILWYAYIRSEKADAVMSGAAQVNSPLRVTDRGREWMAPITDALHKFYCEEGYKLSEDDLYREIEERFRKDLQSLEMFPNGLRGAITAAVLIAKEGAPIEDPCTPPEQRQIPN